MADASAQFPSGLLELTDAQLTNIMALARPLPPHLRSAFLEHVAAALADQPEPGDGSVARVCRQLVREYFDPPR